MALSTVQDYQLAVNQLLYYMDNVCGGIDRERLANYTGMLKADFDTIISAYVSYHSYYEANADSADAVMNGGSETYADGRTAVVNHDAGSPVTEAFTTTQDGGYKKTFKTRPTSDSIGTYSVNTTTFLAGR